MRAIPFHPSIRLAGKVKRMVNRLNSSHVLARYATWRCFDNGREQGYVLSFPLSFNISIVEHRQGDDIVIRFYRKTTLGTNTPTEDEWDDMKCFRQNDVEHAARYVLRRAYKAMEV